MSNEQRFTKEKELVPPKFRYSYWVTGGGDFPFDMLRYDAAWPVSSEDAAKLVYDPKFENRLRSIHLQSNREPTIDRWSSFIWSVGKEKF